jgi:fatty acid desaturase
MSLPRHDAVLRGLPPAERQRLTARADGPGLVRIGLHGGSVILLGAAIAAGVPGWWLLLLPQGVLIVFLFCAMHEASHRTAFATRWLNDAVAAAAGFLLILPPEWFRLFHFAHHRHTQDPAHDPELATPKPETWPGYLRHVSGLPHWRAAVAVLIRNALGRHADPFVPAAARGRITREARVLLALYALLALGSAAAGSALLFWIWVLPMLLGQPFLRLYLLAEHGRCPLVADMFLNSRTTFTTAAVRWLAWNMPFHAEHHAMPSVPFHRLPALHARVAGALGTTERGYLRFTRRYAASLQPARGP